MKQTKSKLLDKIKLLFCILIVPVIVYFVATFLTDQREKEIEFVKTDYLITSGIIIDKTVYKGKSIRVKYIVDNKTYIESDGFEDKYNFKVGDSIKLKYSKTKPQLMITEFNKKY